MWSTMKDKLIVVEHPSGWNPAFNLYILYIYTYNFFSPYLYHSEMITGIQWNLSKRTLRERDTVLNTSPQRTKTNPQIYPSLSI